MESYDQVSRCRETTCHGVRATTCNHLPSEPSANHCIHKYERKRHQMQICAITINKSEVTRMNQLVWKLINIKTQIICKCTHNIQIYCKQIHSNSTMQFQQIVNKIKNRIRHVQQQIIKETKKDIRMK